MLKVERKKQLLIVHDVKELGCGAGVPRRTLLFCPWVRGENVCMLRCCWKAPSEADRREIVDGGRRL